MTEEGKVPQLVDHLFRHQSGQMVSSLTRLFGVENLQLAEDVVQETLLKALQQWSYRGVPENPQGWLWQVAKNQALDVLRREKKLTEKMRLMEPNQVVVNDEAFTNPFDDQLGMMFIGCHPSLSRESQITLLLKTVGGFGVSEIGHALLTSESTIAQRLVRAKNKLRHDAVQFEFPPDNELNQRLDVVLEVLYLIFNEGYDVHVGNSLIRKELCDEAIYLCKLVPKHKVGKKPKIFALLSLMLLQASRLDARTDADGNLILLAEQNRSLWNQNMIHEGLYYLGLSAEGNELSEYHLQAGIAAKHATAIDDEHTDWSGILEDYESLISISASPIVLLNYAVAAAMVHGAQAGLDELDKLKNNSALQNYHWLYTTFGELYTRVGNDELAKQSYSKALQLATNDVERNFLQRKLNNF